ncbi:50S ribosomal protein L25/general stress protein Ctc [Kangiella aquimarina]|uniref:Large ribosomal subunit protein bL25 n=1 Tax=Kangiella aquimarina TaxID=261965 RepID=A0ABZ0X3X7_9GAMM|nr:50S ribosomal protein L25/general stress protein Ctc [Kangiella aquimarina]WQG85089.1 50S ribosomal protein L25/general stress protein Ctc [Kangiella aquimarina]
MSEFTFNAELRSDMGKGASRRLRREADMIPAIVYGGKEEPKSISLNHNQIINMLDEEAVYSSIINLDIDGTVEEVVIKDIQRHPFKPKVLHMDLKRIVRGEIMNATVPLHFLNEKSAPGVKAGGVMSHQITSVEVACRPRNLPEYIEVDLGGLDLGDTIHLSDLKLPEGVELTALQGEEHDLSVANVVRPSGPSEDETEEADEAAEAEVPATEQKGDEEAGEDKE